jgi:hypothetical protein
MPAEPAIARERSATVPPQSRSRLRRVTPIALLLAQTATVTVPLSGDAACAASASEIIVCGRRVMPDRYRLPQGSDLPEANGPPRAEWGLGGGVRAGIAASQSTLPQGASSPRIMVGVKLPF